MGGKLSLPSDPPGSDSPVTVEGTKFFRQTYQIFVLWTAAVAGLAIQLEGGGRPVGSGQPVWLADCLWPCRATGSIRGFN